MGWSHTHPHTHKGEGNCWASRELLGILSPLQAISRVCDSVTAVMAAGTLQRIRAGLDPMPLLLMHLVIKPVCQETKFSVLSFVPGIVPTSQLLSE